MWYETALRLFIYIYNKYIYCIANYSICSTASSGLLYKIIWYTYFSSFVYVIVYVSTSVSTSVDLCVCTYVYNACIHIKQFKHLSRHAVFSN